MATVDLVFRTVHERTAEISLELAERFIQPDNTFVLEGVKPFSETVRKMLRIEHRCDTIVYVDADCLIMEDMRPFIDRARNPYIDCFVLDRFRGRIHCGVHITRFDLFQAMAATPPPENDYAFVLRPESSLRAIAMEKLGMRKEFHSFRIYHDFFQNYETIFQKYALREFRSRTADQRAELETAMGSWTDDLDFTVARHAIEFARQTVRSSDTPDQVARVIAALPELSREHMLRLGIAEKGPFRLEEVEDEERRNAQSRRAWSGGKIFVIGSQFTGTKNVGQALRVLGLNLANFPEEREFFENAVLREKEIIRLLMDQDGLSGAGALLFFRELDRSYPGSKFILTSRDPRGWLADWDDRDETGVPPARREIRRYLWRVLYGAPEFDQEKFLAEYERGLAMVRSHFRDRPGDLLEFRPIEGEGWAELCSFLGLAEPAQHFPLKLKNRRDRNLKGFGPNNRSRPEQ